MNDRRTFLRQLTSLPLIGGGVTLLGQPVRTAVPCTPALLERYVAFLANEHSRAAIELTTPGVAQFDEVVWPYYRTRAPLFWYPEAPDIDAFVSSTRPSSRAAVVLAAAGCLSREG